MVEVALAVRSLARHLVLVVVAVEAPRVALPSLHAEVAPQQAVLQRGRPVLVVRRAIAQRVRRLAQQRAQVLANPI